MKLVMAEKPSVAQSIAKVLGATKREDGYLEGNGFIVSWCVGHLVELAQPEETGIRLNKAVGLLDVNNVMNGVGDGNKYTFDHDYKNLNDDRNDRKDTKLTSKSNLYTLPC